jgi:hypothetical protein
LKKLQAAGERAGGAEAGIYSFQHDVAIMFRMESAVSNIRQVRSAVRVPVMLIA